MEILKQAETTLEVELEESALSMAENRSNFNQCQCTDTHCDCTA